RFFQTLAAHTWIDHQVETNCEAFTDRGWKPGDPYYIADLLVRYGYRYIWSGRDPGTPAGELNMLAPDHPELRTPWLYAHGPDAAGAPRLLLCRAPPAPLAQPWAVPRRAPLLRRLRSASARPPGAGARPPHRAHVPREHAHPRALSKKACARARTRRLHRDHAPVRGASGRIPEA